MSNTSGIDSTITSTITTNGTGKITGAILATTLVAIVAWAAATFSTPSQLTSAISAFAPYNVKTACGAVGDDVTDDTAAVNTCIAKINTAGSGTLGLPCGTYLVNGSGSSVFTAVTGRMSVVGAGSCAQIVLNSAIPTSRDLFHFIGTGGVQEAITISDFAVVPQSASAPVGRHMFHFDCSAATGNGGTAEWRDVSFNRVTSVVIPIATAPLHPANAAGHVIYVNNSGSVNADGCVALMSIEGRNVLAAPAGFQDFDCEECGDSITLSNSQLSGLGGAAYIKQIGTAGSGAGKLIIGPGNTITANGMVQVACGIGTIIFNNEFEQQGTNTEANNSEVDLDGASCNLYAPSVLGNQIQGNPGLGNPTLIRNNATVHTYIDLNILNTPASATHILNTASASALVLGASNVFSGAGLSLSEGTATTVDILTSAGVVGASGTFAKFPILNTLSGVSYTWFNADSTSNGFNGYALNNGTNYVLTMFTATNDLGVGIGTDMGFTLGVRGSFGATGLTTLAASAAGSAGLNLPQGTAPTSPNNGDVWMTSAGLYYRFNGTTHGPL
jgi:hypothetical protein